MIENVAALKDPSHRCLFALSLKVSVSLNGSGAAEVEWEASPAGDVIADAVIALLMHAQSSAASIRLTSKPCRHPRPTDEVDSNDQPSSKRTKSEELTLSRLHLIRDTLREQFENVEVVYEGNMATFEITTDTGLESGVVDDTGVLKCTATVAFDDSTGSAAEVKVECTDQKLASNVQACLRNLAATLVPVQS